MCQHRVTIAGLMGVVLVAALGLMALRESNILWSSALYTVAVLVLLVVATVALQGQGIRRASAVGFTVFGSIYLVLSVGPLSSQHLPAPPLLPSFALDWLFTRVNPSQVAPPVGQAWQTASQPNSYLLDASNSGVVLWANPASTATAGARSVEHFQQSSHTLLALLLGLAGSWLTRWEFKRRVSGELAG